MLNNPNDINVQVKIEVGKVNLTLQELLSLRDGSILKTQTECTLAHLVVNDQVFAQGYLVDIDGLIGVRITTIFSHSTEIKNNQTN